MRVYRIISSVVLVLGLSVATLQAQAQENLTVGVVNLQKLFSQAPQTAAAEKKLQDEFKKRQEQLKKLQSEVLSLREKLGKDGLTMSDDQRGKLENELLRTERKFRWEQNIYDEDVKIRRQEVLGEVQQKVAEAIYKIGQNGKFDLILTEGVIFNSQRVDLTSSVLEELKKK